MTAGVVIAVSAGAGAAAAHKAAVPTGQSSIVEDFGYPGVPADAVQVLTDHKIALTSGDGHIVFSGYTGLDTNCPAPPSGAGRISVIAGPQLTAQATTQSAVTPTDSVRLCFDVLAPSGELKLQVPAVYELDGRTAAEPGHTAQTVATIQPEGGQSTTVTLDPKHATPVGKGINDTNAPTTLLELVVTGS